MDQIKIGQFIAALRKEAGLTQEGLGEKLGLTNKTISRWETGSYMPDIEMLQLLGQTFSVSINELLAGRRLSETEYREKAEENMVAVLKESPFTHREEEGFWAKKWGRDKLSEMIVTGVITVLIYLMLPPLLEASAPLVWCTLPITALVEVLLFRKDRIRYIGKKTGREYAMDSAWILSSAILVGIGVLVLIDLVKSCQRGESLESKTYWLPLLATGAGFAGRILANRKKEK